MNWATTAGHGLKNFLFGIGLPFTNLLDITSALYTPACVVEGQCLTDRYKAWGEDHGLSPGSNTAGLGAAIGSLGVGGGGKELREENGESGAGRAAQEYGAAYEEFLQAKLGEAWRSLAKLGGGGGFSEKGRQFDGAYVDPSTRRGTWYEAKSGSFFENTLKSPKHRASRGGTGQPVMRALIRQNVTAQHDEALRNTIAHGLVMRRSRVRIPKAAPW
jgi:hypothetical protein